MTTADEARADDALSRYYAEGGADARRKAEELVWPVYRGRLAAKEAEAVAPALKQYLELNEGEVVTDAEHGVYAELTRTSRTVWDLRALGNVDLLYLAGMGLLTVNTTAFDALRRAAPSTQLDGIQNTPGVRTSSESSALQVRAL